MVTEQAAIAVRQDGAALRRLRRERGIKPGALAEAVGLKSKSVTNAEGNGASLSFEALHRIARELGVEVVDILSERGRDELGVSV